ncbi:MAG: NTP transferase domain-containing protein [Alphaproteobacteria bacterium]|nr:NTP transferase domain-containing protein [Alphaproteobacteria bacterium]
METKAIILAAGSGTRMNSDIPKALHTIGNRPMVGILIDAVERARVDEIIVVIGPGMEAVARAVVPHQTAVQKDRLGTAHAVLAAEKYLAPFDGCAMILYGDQPLYLPETLQKMMRKCQGGADVVVLGFIPPDARRYGRLVMGDDGLERIVEYKDATDDERAIKLCNSGAMCVNGRHLLSLLKKVNNNNAAGEYYLPDIVALARAQGLTCDVVIGDTEELHGVNTPEELDMAREIYRRRQNG